MFWSLDSAVLEPFEALEKKKKDKIMRCGLKMVFKVPMGTGLMDILRVFAECSTDIIHDIKQRSLTRSSVLCDLRIHGIWVVEWGPADDHCFGDCNQVDRPVDGGKFQGS